MGRVTLTIHIDYDEGASVSVVPTSVSAPHPVLEEAPWPVEVATAPQSHAAPIQPQGLCPTHRVPWKVVPAGISKKTNKPYQSFVACPEIGCEERPR